MQVLQPDRQGKTGLLLQVVGLLKEVHGLSLQGMQAESKKIKASLA